MMAIFTSQRVSRSSETRLAESVARLRASDVGRWTVEQLHELACAMVAAGGDSFCARRVWQRLERGEIDICRAILALQSQSAFARRCRRAATTY
jgi:hypothetical protein